MQSAEDQQQPEKPSGEEEKPASQTEQASAMVVVSPDAEDADKDAETPFRVFDFHLPQALAIYGAIRSFSLVLHVSPIHPIVFSRALLATHSTDIMDIVHMRMQR